MYPCSTEREMVYDNIDEHDVSVQSSDLEPLSMTWNQRPVFGSWYALIPAASFCRFAMTWSRPGVPTGVASSTITVAMPNQPTARHHDSGECFVPGTTQLCVAESSYACHRTPSGRCRWLA